MTPSPEPFEAELEAQQVALREQFGLRADLAWVREVAATGRVSTALPGFPLTAAEDADLGDRIERNAAAGRALREADLASSAGAWIDQRAGGVLHVCLAHPSDTELSTARAIVAGIPAVVDLVELSGRDLQRIMDLISRQHDEDPALRAAAVAWGIDPEANAVHLHLSPTVDPAAVHRLLALTGEHGVHLDYTDAEFVDEEARDPRAADPPARSP